MKTLVKGYIKDEGRLSGVGVSFTIPEVSSAGLLRNEPDPVISVLDGILSKLPIGTALKVEIVENLERGRFIEHTIKIRPDVVEGDVVNVITIEQLDSLHMTKKEADKLKLELMSKAEGLAESLLRNKT